MPQTLRNITRVAVLLIGLAVAALLGLVATSRGDGAPAWRAPRPWSPPADRSLAGLIVAVWGRAPKIADGRGSAACSSPRRSLS